jgi:protein-S-isoprenylcysteine O-methyltransferase Ste14
MLALRSIVFALLLPGTVTVLIPHFIVSGGHAAGPEYWTLWRYLSLMPITIGAGTLCSCIRDFAVAGRGTLAVVDPPKHLVVRGLYHYVRNPMYLSVGTILLGEALFFGSFRLLCYAVVFFIIFHLFVVFYEEPTLLRKFGESYEVYRRRVRRWLPRFSRETAA